VVVVDFHIDLKGPMVEINNHLDSYYLVVVVAMYNFEIKQLSVLMMV
jgi:hypothetical protein